MALITVYDLLEVDEKASKEEIEKSYQKLIMEYHKDPKLSFEENNANEIILNKLKLAYDILIDEEKRKKYDNELAKRRAEELIKNVTSQPEEYEEDEEDDEEDDDEFEQNEVKQAQNIVESPKQEIYQEDEEYEEEYDEDETDENVTLTEEEKNKLKKAAQKEFKVNLKKAQKAEEEYNRAYNEAYNDYLRKLGYTVKEPWTLKRVRNLLIGLLIVFTVCAIIWLLPPTRKLLIQIYEENFIVKSLVDIVVILFNSITSIFK